MTISCRAISFPPSCSQHKSARCTSMLRPAEAGQAQLYHIRREAAMRRCRGSAAARKMSGSRAAHLWVSKKTPRHAVCLASIFESACAGGSLSGGFALPESRLPHPHHEFGFHQVKLLAQNAWCITHMAGSDFILSHVTQIGKLQITDLTTTCARGIISATSVGRPFYPLLCHYHGRSMPARASH